MNAYLNRYVDQFRLRARIRFGTRIVSIAKDDPKDATIPWLVKCEASDGHIETCQFDLVIIATGLFSEPYIAPIVGQEKFTGPIVHPCDVKTQADLTDRRVVIIGAGKCATDMAVLAGKFARTCHLVFRRAHWAFPRAIMNGTVSFRYLLSRALHMPFSPFPTGPHTSLFRFLHRAVPQLFTKITDGISADFIGTLGPDLFDDRVFIPRTSMRNAENLSLIPDEFIPLKRQGRIVGKLAAVTAVIDGTTVELDSGEQLHADMIISATGFTVRFPFFSEALAHALGLPTEPTVEPILNLYRGILPVGIPNIAFIGFVSSLCNFMYDEVASHWVSDSFLGRLDLPATERAMHDEIRTRRAFVRAAFHREAFQIGFYWIASIDAMLQDMGLRMYRTNNWISEYCTVYRPNRFKDLHEERRAKASGKAMHRWYFGFRETILVVIVLLFFLWKFFASKYPSV